MKLHKLLVILILVSTVSITSTLFIVFNITILKYISVFSYMLVLVMCIQQIILESYHIHWVKAIYSGDNDVIVKSIKICKKEIYEN